MPNIEQRINGWANPDNVAYASFCVTSIKTIRASTLFEQTDLSPIEKKSDY